MTDLSIEQINSEDGRRAIPELITPLRDGVGDGAPIGFHPPLSDEEATAYWEGILEDVAKQKRVLLVARDAGKIVGTVQLDLVMKPNGRHRAEVQKLLVRKDQRRRGIGRRLMLELEAVARKLGRTLLILDTLPEDNAAPLYRQLGYVELGAVPGYVRDAAGQPFPTMFFYKSLEIGHQ